jgi:hypothetical protein
VRCRRARLRGPKRLADIPSDGASATWAQKGGRTGLSSTSRRRDPRSKTAQIPAERYPQSITASESIISGVATKTYCHFFSLSRRSSIPGTSLRPVNRPLPMDPA